MADNSCKKKILLCVDGSEYCERAFIFYRDVMHKENHVLVVLHVSDCVKIPSISSVGAFGAAPGIPIDRDEIEAQVQKLKKENNALRNKYIEVCNAAKIDHEVVILPGDIGTDHAIIEYMKQNDLAAVLMGTKGRGKIKRKLMGSVSHHIMHHSHVPVILCPHEDDHYHHHHGKKK